ncbi:MAG: hypothetical protein M3P18_02890 [Actinomycetota bacterium]|nr:hypothetical protein [Actinomycetota bacterium]
MIAATMPPALDMVNINRRGRATGGRATRMGLQYLEPGPLPLPAISTAGR